MLKERWEFLRKELPQSLPDINDPTFITIDNLITDINEKCENLCKFNRAKPIKYYIAENATVRDNNLIMKKFLDLSTYVFLLKLAFNQRTVSLELPHVASGIPHSPERTIGNESFYIAADNVAKHYLNCLNLQVFKWDKFITFTTVPMGKGHFYGAFVRPTRELLFHLSMSEEHKFFVGAYLILAHEAAHAATIDMDYRNNIDKPFEEKKELVDIFWEVYKKYIIDNPSEIMHITERRCKECFFSENHIAHIYHEGTVKNLFREFLTDVIALKIAGKNYVNAFIDYTFLPTIKIQPLDVNRITIDRDPIGLQGLIRVEGCVSFLKGSLQESSDEIEEYVDEYVKELEMDIDKIFEDIELPEKEEPIGEWKKCIDCYRSIGKIWGELMLSLDKYFKENFENSLLSMLIKEEFKIEKSEVKEIGDKLINRTVCPEVMPSKILYIYYELFKKEIHANYAATIFSLVNNQYVKNQ